MFDKVPGDRPRCILALLLVTAESGLLESSSRVEMDCIPTGLSPSPPPQKGKRLSRRGLKDSLRIEKEESNNDTDSICSDATDSTDVSCTSVLSNISSCKVDVLNMKGLKDAKSQVAESEVHIKS